jgi:hypothetical protein
LYTTTAAQPLALALHLSVTADEFLAPVSQELDLELEVRHGRGYVPAERNKREGMPVDVIPIDSIFSPIKKVNFQVEDTRVGQATDYNKLILEVWTDGSVLPQDAVAYAAKILKDHLTIFINFEEQPEEEEPEIVSPLFQVCIGDDPAAVELVFESLCRTFIATCDNLTHVACHHCALCANKSNNKAHERTGPGNAFGALWTLYSLPVSLHIPAGELFAAMSRLGLWRSAGLHLYPNHQLGLPFSSPQQIVQPRSIRCGSGQT